MGLSLDAIQNVVLLFSNPSFSGQNSPSTIIRNLTAQSLGYSAHLNENLTVLAIGYPYADNGVISGLIYVPDIVRDNPCRSLEKNYVPSTAVRQSSLPATNYNLIALAPWFNSSCAQAYLAAAQVDPLRAFIFYHPNHNSTKPYNAASPNWHHHGSSQWRVGTHFPVFAMSGIEGQKMMTQLGRYSGNITEVPFGSNISSAYDPDMDDYVRIWTELRVSRPSGAANVWIPILIVIGCLVGTVALVSALMHYTWHRRRKSLRKRVINGEVNLEALGIKRLTVPLSHVEKFPLFTYNAAPKQLPASPTSPKSPRGPPTQKGSRGQSGNTTSSCQRTITGGTATTKTTNTLSSASHQPFAENALTSPGAHSVLATDLNHQPQCYICLESFVHRSTIIRELQCGHIFHPDCIDSFLSRASSLCPLCKASMLPRGYSPPITNSMIRRERATRKLRARQSVDVVDYDDGESGTRVSTWGSSVKHKLSRLGGRSNDHQHDQDLPQYRLRIQPPPSREHIHRSRPAPIQVVPNTVPPATEDHIRPVAKTATAEATSNSSRLGHPDQAIDGVLSHEPQPSPRSASRAERMRLRMVELAGSDIDSEDGTLWQRMRQSIFPGFR